MSLGFLPHLGMKINGNTQYVLLPCFNAYVIAHQYECALNLLQILLKNMSLCTKNGSSAIFISPINGVPVIWEYSKQEM